MNEVLRQAEYDHTDWSPETEDAQEAPQTAPTDISDLAWIARRISAYHHRIGAIKKYRDEELNRIAETCAAKTEILSQQSGYWESIAHDILRAHGYCYGDDKAMCRYEMPGIGTFRFTVTRQAVDGSEYDALSDEEKADIQKRFSAAFTVTTKINPDKKMIAAALKRGEGFAGFKLTEKKEKLEYKLE